jgi:hypothetical protein
MFLLRSAFWLTLLFSAMPFDRGEISRGVDQAAAPAVSTTRCDQRATMCDSALASFVADRRPAAPASLARDLFAQKSSGKEGPRSADSLTAEDRAAPWRGRPGNSGA